MDWQTSKVGMVALRLLKIALLLAVLSGLVMAQDAAKPAPSTAPDTASKSATGVRPDSYIIGAEDVLTVFVWKEPDMTKTEIGRAHV